MKKFTLLELLVVVAVMIILLSLLLPALQKAKDAGRAVVCLNNQKQCAILAMSYMGDYNGSLVVYESSSGDRPWHRYLYDYGYLKDYNITVCPSWSPFKYDTTLANKKYYAYGMNIYFASTPFFTYIPGSYRTLHAYKVPYPSEYFLFGDTLRMPDNQQLYEFTSTTTALTTKLHTRHRNNANIVFLDGHAAPCNENRIIEAARKVNGNSITVQVYDKNTILKTIYP